MGALRQPRPTEPIRKPPARDNTPLRDPNSPAELLRTKPGYSPFYHKWNADIPRILGKSYVMRDIISVVNMLSLGREHRKESPRHDCTELVSYQSLADLTQCGLRDIQRHLPEMAERGILDLKMVKVGAVPMYIIALRPENWPNVESYAVWQRKQVVAIAEGQAEEPEDEPSAPVSKDAVLLTKTPQRIPPGRASRAVAVKVGVTSFKFQNDDVGVDLIYHPVVQSGGCLVVSVASKQGEQRTTQSEMSRHPRRDIPTNRGSAIPPHAGSHPRADEIVNLFNPVLEHYGAHLIHADKRALKAACAELGEMPPEFLAHWVNKPGGRASSKIKKPTDVAPIIKEARKNWEYRQKEWEAKRLSEIARYRDMLAHPNEAERADPEWADMIAGKLKELERA
jgi:hypothetical protein